VPALATLSVVVTLTGALVLNLSLLERLAHAFGPSAAATSHAGQDQTWLAAKNAFRVRRAPRPGGSAAPPACGVPCAAYPTAYLLDTRVVANTLEPAKVGTDAAGHAYLDHNMSKLCGAGAAANTLAFWNDDIRHEATARFTDTANGVTTTWDGAHNRAYVAYLAWQAALPGAPHPGMMDTHDPSTGVTLYGMRDALNWEASGQDTALWRTYFYTITWSDQSSADDFHHKVRDDLTNTHVPVVAEVSARLLPNWSPKGNTIYHFITIVGYDDAAGIYYYTDSCGASTGCGALSDGGLLKVSQAQLWAAITAVQVNTSDAFDAGDGGFVW
jgi:hypothetical protein